MIDFSNLKMMERNCFFYIVIFLFLGSITACDGDRSGIEDELSLDSLKDYDIAIPSSRDQPGLGKNTDKQPIGSEWVLPPGIRIVQRPNYPFDPSLDKLFGHTNHFYADVSFVNDRIGGGPVVVEFPPGLILISALEGVQNGLVIERVLITIPPNESGPGGLDTTTIYIGAACLNESKGSPWEDNPQFDDVYHYPVGKNLYNKYKVTSDPNLLRLLELLKDKPKLKLKQHWDPTLMYTDENYVPPVWLNIYNLIGMRIWDITDGQHGILYKDLKELVKELEAYK